MTPDDLFLLRKYKIYRSWQEQYNKRDVFSKDYGAMADQLGSGLQNRLDRCNSGSRLHYSRWKTAESRLQS